MMTFAVSSLVVATKPLIVIAARNKLNHRQDNRGNMDLRYPIGEFALEGRRQRSRVI